MPSNNPNATAGLLGGGIGAEVVLNVAKAFGWDISTGYAVWIAAIASGVVLFIGRNGFAGLWNLLKFGTGGAPKAGP